jgi:DNA-dependent metalloprotease WSS1
MSKAVSSGNESPTRISHILSFSNEKDARELLNRVWDEFQPIVQQRGYRIVSLSELCCCRGFTKNGSSKSRRTKVSPTLWGYNQSRGDEHAIHLRLRQPQNHSQLLPYEDVAGTMAHELAHCVHGPHSVSFYRLMEQILEQHAVAMIEGFKNQQSIRYFSGKGHVLGGNATPRSSRWMPQGPQKLGGWTAMKPHIHPREAAAAAAMDRRRVMDEIWCQPCQYGEKSLQTIVDLTNDDDDDDNDKIVTMKKRSTVEMFPTWTSMALDNEIVSTANTIRPRKRLRDTDTKENATMKTPIQDTNDSSNHSTIGIFDLTSETRMTAIELPPSEENGWQCEQCTFINKLDLVICSMCLMEKDNISTKLISEILCEEERTRLQELEREKSIRNFGMYPHQHYNI